MNPPKKKSKKRATIHLTRNHSYPTNVPRSEKAHARIRGNMGPNFHIVFQTSARSDLPSP